MALEQLRPPAELARAGIRKISTVGQVTIPAPVLRRWEIQDGGSVHAFDLDDAVLLNGEDLEPLLDLSEAKNLGRYAVSSVGQITLPAVARDRWGLRNGGKVDFLDLHSSILFMQRGSSTERLRSVMPSRDLVAAAIISRA